MPPQTRRRRLRALPVSALQCNRLTAPLQGATGARQAALLQSVASPLAHPPLAARQGCGAQPDKIEDEGGGMAGYIIDIWKDDELVQSVAGKWTEDEARRLTLYYGV